MQSHEERADEMLRMMGGYMPLPVQRVTLRRLILAEDSVSEYRAVVREYELSMQTQYEDVCRLRRSLSHARGALQMIANLEDGHNRDLPRELARDGLRESSFNDEPGER